MAARARAGLNLRSCVLCYSKSQVGCKQRDSGALGWRQKKTKQHTRTSRTLGPRTLELELGSLGPSNSNSNSNLDLSDPRTSRALGPLGPSNSNSFFFLKSTPTTPSPPASSFTVALNGLAETKQHTDSGPLGVLRGAKKKSKVLRRCVGF